MSSKRCIVAGLLLVMATIGYSADSAKFPEQTTLEMLRKEVARNEELINPIKMSYTNKKENELKNEILHYTSLRSE